MSKLRVGLIGAGDMAGKHLEVLRQFPDVDVVALASRGEDKLGKLASHFGIDKRFLDYLEMLRTISLDAIFVLVSASNIYEVSSECISRGINSLIEKPPGLISAQTEQLLNLSSGKGGKHMIGLNRRFYGTMKNAKELLQAEGPLVSILVEGPEDLESARALGIHPPEVIGNWLAANGIHCIDLLRFFGGEPTEVHSSASAWREKQPDSYGALIRFDRGAIGHYVSNWTSPGRWRVVLYAPDLRIDICPLEQGKIFRRGAKESAIQVNRADTDFKPGLFAQDRFFLDCVKYDRPIQRPGADLHDALLTMRLIDKIRKSTSVQV